MKIVAVGVAAYCLLVGIFLFGVTLRAELEEMKLRGQPSVSSLSDRTFPAMKKQGKVQDPGIGKAA